MCDPATIVCFKHCKLQIPDSSRFLVGQYVTIHDDVISHVNITNVKEEDGGEYMCTAQNIIGKYVMSNFYLLFFFYEAPEKSCGMFVCHCHNNDHNSWII